MQENQEIDKGRGIIFSIYLVAVFLNAFVDLGQNHHSKYNLYDLW